jgi:hypothetical protein
MKQTAVEWLKSEMLKPNLSMIDILEQAKEMEKQHRDEFAIDFIKWTISQEAEELIHDLKMVGEVSKTPTTEELLKVYKRFWKI